MMEIRLFYDNLVCLMHANIVLEIVVGFITHLNVKLDFIFQAAKL